MNFKFVSELMVMFGSLFHRTMKYRMSVATDIAAAEPATSDLA